MRGLKMRLGLLVIAASIWGSTLAVDKNKFRTCTQGSFCKRYKKYVKRILKSPRGEPGSFSHVLDSESLSLEGHIVRARLKHANDNSSTVGDLLLEISLFRDAVTGNCGITRLTIDEEAPLYSRFRIRDGDVVSKSLLPDQASLQSSAEGISLITAAANGNCSVSLRHRPFEVDMSAGGRTLHQLNARHLLNFERYRKRGDAEHQGLIDATDVSRETLWEEDFDGHTDKKPRGPAAVGIDVTFANAPVVTGLAEHACKLHLGSTKFDEPFRLYNLDVFEYEIDTPMALYGNVPMVTAVHRWMGADNASTTAASGLLMLNPSEGFVQVEGPPGKGVSVLGNTNTWWLFESGVLDIFSFAGPSPQAVLNQYHSVTGWPRLPPVFSLGKHQSRWNYVDTEDVLSVDQSFDQHRVPYDVLWLDLEHTDGKKYFTWEPRHFADAGKMLDAFARKQRNIVTIIDPHIKKDANYTVYNSLKSMDLFTRSSAGSDYEGFCWPGDSYYPDFCNPATRDAWAKLFLPSQYEHSRSNLYTWNDMNEPSVFNGPEVSMPRDNLHKCHADSYSVEHRDMHNLYGFYHHEASVQGQLERSPELRPFVLTRSFFAGSHRHGPIWTGDNKCEWSHMTRSIPMLLSLSLCGISLAGADVPGFFGEPDMSLYVRWHQLGIWYPFYRAHAHLTSKRREPWLFGDQVLGLVRSAVLTRYRLLPMWYTLIAEWALRGWPVLRPLWYHDLGDLSAYGYADNHFWVGESIIVRGVASERARNLESYLPAGDWFDFWNMSAPTRPGGKYTLTPHLEHVPVFVKSGQILVEKQRPRRSTSAMANDPVTVVVYGTPARGRIYIDDGSSHRYKSGAFLYDELHFDGTALRAKSLGASLPALSQGLTQSKPGVADSGLRIERLVLVGLPKKPQSARVLIGSRVSSELKVSCEAVAEGATWKATVRNPAVLLGSHDWAVELSF